MFKSNQILKSHDKIVILFNALIVSLILASLGYGSMMYINNNTYVVAGIGMCLFSILNISIVINALSKIKPE